MSRESVLKRKNYLKRVIKMLNIGLNNNVVNFVNFDILRNGRDYGLLYRHI